MVWVNREINEKIERIKELKEAGLNTPRMFYLKKFADPNDLIRAFDWAAMIHYKSPDQIFNIRTYNYSGERETSQTEHFTDIKFDDLEVMVLEINLKYVCMIDAETPNDGRLAGNVVFDDVKSPTGRLISTNFTIEYCEKEIRAMVRDHDKQISGSISGELYVCGNELTELKEVIRKAFKFKHGVILEWTWFCKPSGVKLEPLVFWEYRKI
jgi:hypothetical protein